MSTSRGRHLSYPFRIGPDGRSAAPANDAEHIRDQIVQLILTAPGERPFLPDFGGGARRLIFENTSDALHGVVKARVTQAVSNYLGHLVTIEQLDVVFQGETIEISLQYRPAGTSDSRVLRFQRQGQ